MTRDTARVLIKWFHRSARDLPWRHTTDPYAVWVSEIMLQQTQVKTVIPYWERWMRDLPTIRSLAAASPESIHKLWEGLGYYSRVRNLQLGAQAVLHQHGGVFPQAFDSILGLPGIGRYTAGAICSIAFDQAKNLYVVDAGDGTVGAGTIFKYDLISGGSSRTTFRTNLNNPQGLALDGSDLLVSEKGADRVLRVPLDGVHPPGIFQLIAGPLGLASQGARHGTGVYRYIANGRQTEQTRTLILQLTAVGL